MESSDFEALRIENIRRNKEALESLGLTSNPLGIPANTAATLKPSAAPHGHSSPRKRPRKVERTTIEPTRKSRRLANSVNLNHSSRSPEAESDTETPGRITLRTLSPPPIPAIPATPATHVAAPPTRDKDGPGGILRFTPETHFTPNLTPEDMMRFGSFGGTFFRPFHSKVLHDDVPADHDEFPSEWYEGLDVDKYLTSETYDPTVNKYGVKASQSIQEWERAGWIRPQDPRGFFQWYCRFYMGRRTEDDERQIKRWTGCCGANGRFKKSLIKTIARAGGRWDDETIAPVLRQTLQHWGYILTEEDYRAYL